MVVLSKIYTKTGDKGLTSLGNGKKVEKCCDRIKAIGEVDELNAHIGYLHSLLGELPNPDRCPEYHRLRIIMNNLFDVGADLCVPIEGELEGCRIREECVTVLEQEIDSMNETLEPLKSFILPSGGPFVASVHIARAVCRRAERAVAELMLKDSKVNPIVLQYLNRLSDYLFVLARYKTPPNLEVLWVPGR